MNYRQNQAVCGTDRSVHWRPALLATQVKFFMSRIPDLFKPGRSNAASRRRFEDVLRIVRPHAVPALTLRKTDGASRSFLGGNPCLPAGMEWPSKDGQALTLLASLDLEEISSYGVVSWLPDSGKLLFFYDAINQPWGFDPADRGGWSVIYLHAVGSGTSAPCATLPKIFLEYREIESLPDWKRLDDLGIKLDESDVDSYVDGYVDWLADEFVHQVGGYPRPVQGDWMELECQLASNGIRCDDAGYDSAEGKRLASGARDWRLLLQFSSDDDLGVMWGDAGDLYFWVREQDALKGDFSKVWLVLQCC